MTDKTPPPAQRHSDQLREELNKLKNAPLLQRGDAAVQLAAKTVAALGHLETRIEKLEELSNAT